MPDPKEFRSKNRETAKKMLRDYFQKQGGRSYMQNAQQPSMFQDTKTGEYIARPQSLKSGGRVYDNGGKTQKKGVAQSDSLERSKEQVLENAAAEQQTPPMYKKPKTEEELLAEAVARRNRNRRINRKRDASGRDKRGAPRLDDQNLRNEDGSPLRGGSKLKPITPKGIETKTPKKTLNRSIAVIPVPSKKELRQRKNRN